MAGDCGSTCPVPGGWYEYDPSIAGNAIITALFAFLLPVTIFFGIRYKTLLFSGCLAVGIALDVVGFVGRILLHGARDNKTSFLLSQLGTILGPSFIAAAVFLVLPHVLTIYGVHLSPIRPLTAAFMFYVLVVLAVVLQITGAVVIANKFTNATRHVGSLVIAAGLIVQIVAIICFLGLRAWSMKGMKSARPGPDYQHAQIYGSPRFRKFSIGLDTSAALLLAYSIYRLVEMIGGLAGPIFQNKISFIVINGVVPLVCSILLTVFHPGRAFGHYAWAATSSRRSTRHAAQRSSLTINPRRSNLADDAHIRYDPNIRSRFSPREGFQMVAPQPSPNYPQTPHDILTKLGSPGLPSGPRALKELAERRLSETSSKDATLAAELSPISEGNGSTTQKGDQSPVNARWSKGSKGASDSSERRPVNARLVDSEAIW